MREFDETKDQKERYHETGKKIFVSALLTGVVALADLGAVQAGDYSPVWQTMRPLYAVSFDVGRKHVLSYFLSKRGLCDLDRPPPNGPGRMLVQGWPQG